MDLPATVEKSPAPVKRRRHRHVWLLRAVPILRFLARAWWATLRIEIDGLGNALDLIERDQPFIACFWHQQQFVCVKMLLDLHARGLRTGFLISPSADGDIAARLLETFDVTVIRGSATRTGALALRDLVKAISAGRVSPMMAPDGPKGPIFVFKPGTALLAQLTGAPLVPMSFTAKRAWHVGSWDKLVVPRPFTRVKVAIGEPHFVGKGADIEGECREMEKRIEMLNVEC